MNDIIRALHWATAYVELDTPNGAQDNPEDWPRLTGGDVDARRIASECRRALKTHEKRLDAESISNRACLLAEEAMRSLPHWGTRALSNEAMDALMLAYVANWLYAQDDDNDLTRCAKVAQSAIHLIKGKRHR